MIFETTIKKSIKDTIIFYKHLNKVYGIYVYNKHLITICFIKLVFGYSMEGSNKSLWSTTKNNCIYNKFFKVQQRSL